MGTSGDWRDRFTQPRILGVKVAPADRTAGLVLMVDGNRAGLHAWDVLTGQTRPVATPPADLWHYWWIGPDGRYGYVLADEQGNELGHVTAVDLRGARAPVDLTPTLDPYPVRGLALSRAGHGLVLDVVRPDGYYLYYLADPAAANPAPRLLAHYRHEAWRCQLSADVNIATIDVTEQNPGLRRFAVQAVRVADGEPIGLYADGPGSSVEARLFSPRAGDSTVAVTTDRSGVRRPVLWRIDDGSRRPLALGDLPGEVIPLDWSDEGRYLLLCQFWRAAQRLLRYDLDTDRVEPLDLPPGSYHDDLVGSSGFGPDRTVLATIESLANPTSVYRHRPGSGRPAEPVLRSAAPPGVPGRSVDIRSSDGTLAQGWFATPPAGAEPYPAIIRVHGGPHWVEQDAYDPFAQMLLDHGYAYLGLNYRGSTSFGKDYQEMVWGDIGHWEIEDLVAARQWLVGSGIADPSQIFVTGDSYGGFLTLYALSVRPELWAGGFAEVAVADWELAYQDANPAIRRAMATWLGGTPDQVPQRYRERSPRTHLAALAAPLLIRQGRHDSRTAARQMEVYEQEARQAGKPVTVRWNDGGHAPLSDDQLAFEHELLEFLADCRHRPAGAPTGPAGPVVPPPSAQPA